MKKHLRFSCLPAFLLVAGCVTRTVADAPLTPRDVPPLTLPAGTGMMVDSYDHGNYFGAFHDDKGSTLTVDTLPYAAGEPDKFLFGSFHLTAGGYVGMWSQMGEKWNVPQDWSQAKTITFAAYTSKPMTFAFTFKSDDKRQFSGTAATTQARVWQTLTIPIASLTDIGSGLGLIGGFDLKIQSDGDGQFALDDLRVDGGQAVAQGDDGKPLEMRPEVIFAKTLTPPTERSHTTYIVDSGTGSDTGPGTAARPWKTIQHAADTLLPGDTVLVKGGVYAEQAHPGLSGLSITRSGAPDAPITYAAFPGQHPKLTCPWWAAAEIKEAAYINFRGFDLTTTYNAAEKRNVGFGLGISHSHHITVSGCLVHDCGGGGIGADNSDYITLEHNVASGNAFSSIYNCSGLSLYECRALDTKPGYHDVLRANVCFRNENKGPTPLYGGELTDGNGIIIDWQRGVAPVLIENNICYDNGGRGIHVFHSAHVLVRNNTLAGNERTHGAKGSDLRANSSDDVRFVGNIVVATPGQAFAPNYQPTNVTYADNLFFGYSSVTLDGTGTGNLLGKDPLFVRPSLTDPDFHLRPASPARSAVPAADAAPTDFTGRPRPPGKPADMGAFQH